MDAMLKRRMWKVAIAHFALSIFFLWKAIHFGDVFFEPVPPVLKTYWEVYYFLQPLLWIGLKLKLTALVETGVFIFCSIPVWSICFGWILVKFANWLNHFPILGKRVF